jgi:hypothetical protein
MHVTIHTSQTWADTFISELNDTHVEAELRTKHIPPQVTHLPALVHPCNPVSVSCEPLCAGQPQAAFYSPDFLQASST